ncbi:MAG TPA: 50S ribosomal protein L22 [Candidatus Saccharimonadales bacterium]|nr:50S ribosomal protein L22 [Candidatus Saccharimonadales bacterium]
MIVKASAKSVRISPRKVGVVAALVRGRTLSDAIAILEHTPRSSALPLKKLMESAKANALHNYNLVEDSLKLKSINVTPGPRLKRYRPAAHGRALPYEKKSSHIYVEVDGHEKVKKKPATKKIEDKKESK